MENIHGIYKITNKINGKTYVGYACSLTIKERYNIHKNNLNANNHRNHYLQEEWNIYGEKSFILEILEEINTNAVDNFSLRESYWCDELKSYYYQNGYNIREAGKNGKLSTETKNKISIKNSGLNNPFYGKSHSFKTKYKISRKNKISLKGKTSGNNHYLFGKNHTIETKKKISETQKKKYKQKENHPMFGKKISEETRKKMSKSKKNENNSFYGKKHTIETKKKISEKLKGREVKNKIKLTDIQIEQLCIYFNNNMSNKEILFYFNMSESTLSKIKKELWQNGKIHYYSRCASKKQILNLLDNDIINSIISNHYAGKTNKEISYNLKLSMNIVEQTIKCFS